MQIIRDEEGFGLFMIPLFCDWHVRRCNVEGRTNKPSTIITRPTPDIPVMGMCEEHYQEGNIPGGKKFTLVFDDFDAFKENAQ